MLKISNLHVSTTDNKPILKGIDLDLEMGHVHAVMGPNGAGKSTLASSLMGHPAYVIDQGSIHIGKTNLTQLSPDKRAKKGIFLAFQYPVEIPGVTVAHFLKTAVDTLSKKRSDIIEFRQELKTYTKQLHIEESFIDRSLNEGFSGGEKKKMEMLQLLMLKPKYVLLDETDSGLDVDALRVIGETITSVRAHSAILIITHYQRILKYVKPDFVHIMKEGTIVQSGKAALAEEIEEKGYANTI